MISQKQVLIGIIMVAISFAIGGGLMFDRAEGDITNESKAVIYNFVKDTYVSQVEFDLHTKVHTDYHQAASDEFKEVSANFTNVDKAHKNLMAMVATEETTGITDPVSTTGFNLVTDEEWKRGELITITGMLAHAAKLEAVLTHIADADYKRTFNIAVFDDKTFVFPFALAGNDPLGQYTVTFKSLGKFNSISFKAIE